MIPNVGKLVSNSRVKGTVHTYLISLEEQVNRKCKKFAKANKALVQGCGQVTVWLGATYKIPAKTLIGLVCVAMFVIPITSSKVT